MATSRHCPRCGAELAAGALAGLCPRCLMGNGLAEAGRDEDRAQSGAEATQAEPPPGGQAPLAGEPTDEQPVPAEISGYRVIRLIGVGSMGAVYEARQPHPRRTVALKVLKAHLATPRMLRRFAHEAEVLGRLQHPGIAQVYESGTVDTGRGPQPFFAMELIHGPEGREAATLTEYAEQQALTTSQRLELLAKVADAVHYAHQKGVIHRDLKPANILVDEAGQPKILDFGVARITDSDIQATTMQTDIGQILGTLPYMSPEQAGGDPAELDTRSDVYALGVLCYELLARRLPYTLHRRVIHEAVRVIREAEPTRLSLIDRAFRGDVETIVAKALDKDKARRYQSASDLATDIRRFLSDEPIIARRPSAWYQLGKFAKRNKALVGGIAGVFLALVLGIIGTSLGLFQARRAERKSQAARRAEARARAREATQRREAQRQARIANARRLAVESREALEYYPQRSLLLAVEALQATLRHGEPRIPAAEQALRDGLAAVGGKVLRGHDAGIISAQISRDGHWLVTENLGGGPWSHEPSRVRVWDLTAEDPAAASREFLGSVCLHEAGRRNRGHHAVAISSDGRWLVVGGGLWQDAARVWDLAAQAPGAAPIVLRRDEPMPPELNRNPTCLVRISPDRHWIVTVSGYPSVVELWDFSAGKPPAAPIRLPKQDTSITCVAFSPNGRRLVAARYDGTVRVWDLTAGGPAAEPIVLRTPDVGTIVAFGPNGRWLITGSHQWAAALWDLAAKDPGAAPIMLRGHASVVTCVAISPDGRWAATGSGDATVRLWNLTAKDPAARPVVLRGPAYGPVAFSPNSRWLVTGGPGNAAQLWDLRADDPGAASVVLRGHEGGVTSVAFSPDGRRLVTASLDKTARLWDMRCPCPQAAMPVLGDRDPRIPRREGRTGDNRIKSLTISPDSRWLLAGGRWGPLPARLWDLTAADPTQEPIVLRGVVGGATCVAISPNNRWAGIGCRDKIARLWDLTAEDPGAAAILLRGHGASQYDASILAVAFSPDNRWFITASSDKTARLWDLTAKDPAAAPIVLRGHRYLVRSAAFSHDGSWVATGGSAGKIRLWDLRAEDPAAAPTVLRGYEGPVRYIAISPDNRWLACGGGRGVRLWDRSDPNKVASSIALPAYSSGPCNLAFSPDGRRLAVASASRTVDLWNLTAKGPTRAPIVLRGDEGIPGTVTFSPDGKRLVFGTFMWDLTPLDRSPTPIALHAVNDEPLSGSAFSPDNRWLVIGDYDGLVTMWDLKLSNLIDMARRTAGRELTAKERDVYMIPRIPEPRR